MSPPSSSEKPTPTRPQRETAGQLPSRFKPESSPETRTLRKKRTTRVSLLGPVEQEPLSELPTPPKEPRQLFEMASGSKTPDQLPLTAQSQLLEPRPVQITGGELPRRYIPEPSAVLPSPDNTSNGSTSSDDNNVSLEPATLSTLDNTSNASNSSSNNNVLPKPKVYSCVGHRIYVYPKDHPYVEELPEYWGKTELAKWDAIKQEKIREGEAEWDKMIDNGAWNRKKKGVFVYWEYIKDGRRYQYVLCKEDPPAGGESA